MTAINGFTQEMLDDVESFSRFLAGIDSLQAWQDDILKELGLSLPMDETDQRWLALSEVVATTAFVPLGTTPFEYIQGIITLKSPQQFHYARVLYDRLKELNS